MTQKQEHFKNLREKWQKIKNISLSSDDTATIDALRAKGQMVSPYGYIYAKISMQENGYDGIPYIDAKTFNF